MSLDLVPMLLLSLLLLTTGQPGAQTAEVVLGGEHDATGLRGALIVGDGRVTVPAGAEVGGPIHVLGGETRILGTVEGDVTHIGGTLDVAGGARITGTLQYVGGTLDVDPAADVARRTSLEVVPDDPRPVQRFLPVVAATAVLAFVGARRARRRPGSLDHLRAAVERHPLISLTVGALVAVTFLSLFVFMAFTLVLLPVSLLGLAAGLVAVGYGVVALGAVVGRRLPLRRPDVKAAAGVVAVMAAFQVLGLVPFAGSAVTGGLLLAGLGAVLLTYFGLQEFTPAARASIAEVES